MALPSTGQITLSQIRNEIQAGTSGQTSSLYLASTGSYGTIGSNLPRPDGVAPHSMSEFRGYSSAGGAKNISLRSGTRGCSGGVISIGSPVTRSVYYSTADLEIGTIFYTTAAMTTRVTYSFMQYIIGDRYFQLSNGAIVEIIDEGTLC